MLATAEIVVGVTAAHLLAGGALPDPWSIAALTLLVFGLSAAFLRGALGYGALGYWTAVAVGSLAQVAVHIGYAALPAAGSAAAGHGAHAGHAGHATAGVNVSAAEPSSSMVLAHAVSALVVAAVWSIRMRALDAAVGWLRADATEPPSSTPRVARTMPRPRTFFVELGVPTRGPPVVAARRAT